MKHPLPLLFLLLSSLATYSQIDFNIGDKFKKKVDNKVNQKVDEGIDKSIDKTEEEIKNEGKKNANKEGEKSSETEKNEKASKNENTNSASSTPTLKSYSKFDFIPGEKILVAEDFTKDAIGDFPLLWNTNSTGEIVTVEGHPGRWLSLSKDGVYIPEFITALPDNFTFEFELMCNETFSYYSTPFNINISKLAEQKDAFRAWKQYGEGELKDGVNITFHPTSAGNGDGNTSFTSLDKGAEVMHNETSTMQFFFKSKNNTKISIWRQKNRLRVYMNEEKVWDLPRGFPNATAYYNNISFTTGAFNQPEDRYLITNLKLAVGAPDTRNKLLTEGKFSTSGILFDSGSDRIKSESYGVMKDIANVLQENPSLKVKIIGYTDSDGDDNANLELSKRRSEAVRKTLSAEFSIDQSRMSTDGMGEKQPIADNTKPEGKAQNRRVEFVKL